MVDFGGGATRVDPASSVGAATTVAASSEVGSAVRMVTRNYACETMDRVIAMATPRVGDSDCIGVRMVAAQGFPE